MEELERVTTAQIFSELRQVVDRYAKKANIANYSRSVAFGAFIDGALFAQGKYIALHDKDFKRLKTDWINITEHEEKGE